MLRVLVYHQNLNYYMKTNKLWATIAIVCTLVACQQENPTNLEKADIHLTATKTFAGFSSRSVDITNTFRNGNKIGLFLPEQDTDTEWTYTDGRWNVSTPCQWKNKTDRFTFVAYAPYTSGSRRNAIGMPELNAQSGNKEDIAAKDFLMAEITTAYTDNNGTVAFTGANAFKHVYSLIVVTLKDESEDNVTLKTLGIEGKGFFTKHTYNLKDEPKGMTIQGEAIDRQQISVNKAMTGEGLSYYFLVNPVSNNTSGSIDISFSRGNKNFTASSDGLGQRFEAGKLYQYTFSLKKGVLILQGADVLPWEIEENSENYLEEVPAE